MTERNQSRDSLALAAICLSALMFGLEISSVPVVLPAVERALHGSFAGGQWVMNAYTIAVTTVLMAVGALADRFGRKRLLSVAVVTFGVASLACGSAATMAQLVAARAAQGLSGGAMLICSVAALSHQFRSGRRRARAFGVWGVVFGIGLGFGPVVGGLIVTVSSWRWVFLAHVPLAAVTVPLLLLGVRESVDAHARRVDVPGMVSLSAAIFGLAFFITQGSLLMLGLSGIAAACFVLVETRRPEPMFEFGVFRIRTFSGALISSAAMNFSFWPLIVYLPTYLQDGLGYSAGTASAVLLAYTLPALLLPPLAERLALRHEPRTIVPPGLLTIGCGLLAMALGSGVHHPSWATLLPGMVIAGCGLALTNTPTTNATTGSVPADRSGMASGLDMTARMTALAVNISVMGQLFSTGGSGRGLERIALYGGVAAFVLAAASRLTFGRGRPTYLRVRTLGSWRRTPCRPGNA